MLHDPKVYSNPMDFNPDRFNGLDSEMKKVTELTFGFGRRFCPGTHFGESTLFSVVSTTLATCDVLPGLDKDGNEALPKCVYTSGTIVYVHFLHLYPILTSLFFSFRFPEPFTLRLRARSAHATELLTRVSSIIE